MCMPRPINRSSEEYTRTTQMIIDTIHESYSIIYNPTLGTYISAIVETYNVGVKPKSFDG